MIAATQAGEIGDTPASVAVVAVSQTIGISTMLAILLFDMPKAFFAYGATQDLI